MEGNQRPGDGLGAWEVTVEPLADGDYQIIVVPLLVSSPLRHFVDRVLVVDCDPNTQIQRLLARDTETAEQARKILAAQTSREERLAIANDVIRNDGDLEQLRERVIELADRYSELAGLRARP